MKLITKDFLEAVKNYPLYSQDGKMCDALVVAKFFCGSFTWYVTECDYDSETGNCECFGLVDASQNVEMGYFSVNEMEQIKINVPIIFAENGKESETRYFPVEIERDLYFKPCKIKDLKNQSEGVKEWIKTYSKP